MNSGGMITVGLVGATSWRAPFFVTALAALTDRLELVGVSGRSAPASDIAAGWGVPRYDQVDGLIAGAAPDLVITCVPWAVNETLIGELVDTGVTVLAETPPAEDQAGLRRLWSRVGPSAPVQVAEQYLYLPGHAARLRMVRDNMIGTPTSVQVSSTHSYHAVSMIRGLLGVDREDLEVQVRATRSEAPLLDPLDRAGWTANTEPQPAATTIATLDFGDGRTGLYDFTDNQWHNQLRFRRLLVRGSHGEIRDDDVIRWAGPRSIVRESMVRSQLGQDLNLDGHDTEHISFGGKILWRNNFVGRRWMDEEIAIASLVADTASWMLDAAPAPYPLPRACQDHLIGLAIEQAAEDDRPVRVPAGIFV